MEPLPPKKTADDGLKIAGINIGVFVLYCIISILVQGNIFGALVVCIGHVILCFILAIALRKWIWALSGLLILIIGFSTCVVGVMNS